MEKEITGTKTGMTVFISEGISWSETFNYGNNASFLNIWRKNRLSLIGEKKHCYWCLSRWFESSVSPHCLHRFTIDKTKLSIFLVGSNWYLSKKRTASLCKLDQTHTETSEEVLDETVVDSLILQQTFWQLPVTAPNRTS